MSQKQLYFKELFVGTLIYAVVLGFFNDYTSVVYAKSFSTIFLASMVLEALTFGVFTLKNHIIHISKGHQGLQSKLVVAFSIWFILFSSKFVFIWVIDVLFGDNMNINGFFGILWVVLSVTLIHKLAEYVFVQLGENG